MVVKRSRADIVKACLRSSIVWPKLTILTLQTNMRVTGGLNDADYIAWCKRLPYDPSLRENPVKLPDYIHQSQDIDSLIQRVYPNNVLQRAVRDPDSFVDRCLLTILNATVTELNAKVLQSFPGAVRTYLSTDTCSINEGKDIHIVPDEQLKSIDLPSLPPSKLDLKIGAPVMLIRNLN